MDPSTQTVVDCLTANHANTLALLAVLRACDVPLSEARPYRDVEGEVADDSAMGLTMQTSHTLASLLIKAGALVKTEVPEEPTSEKCAQAAADASEQACESVAAQPIDYLLSITQAGSEALAQFDPAVRFVELAASEPDGYLEAYARVIDACSAPEGASRAQIEQALAGHPALVTPKRVYPSYFVSKLETLGGLSWSGAWHATAAGEAMLACL